MKKLLLIALLLSGFAYAQKNPVEAVTKAVTKNEAEAHLPLHF